ncbi:M48 family metalloprotease [Streptomyces sp. NPDC001652]|uniref:M48 family metallopeptidase n=1 Tax=Streptomyces sp. NPDC001652 TaxID=3154393 RepID=UPI003323707C
MRHLLREALVLVVIGLLVVGSLLLAVLIGYWLFFIGGFTVLVFFWAPPAFIFLGVVVFPLLAADARAVRGVRRTGGLPESAELISRADAPQLRELVADVARSMGTSAPTHLWLTPHANASVHEVHRLFRRPRRIRHMCIGVPLLVGLPTDQLRAVLCHELGHYARRHAPFSNTIYRGSALLGELLTELDHAVLPVSDVSPVDTSIRSLASVQRRVISLYRSLYDLVTLAIRRRQEYEADRAAAEIVGNDVMAGSLLSSHTVAVSWKAYRTGILDPLHAYGRTPDDPYETFGALWQDSGRLPQVVPPSRSPRRDSHPPLEKRLAALNPAGVTHSVTGPAAVTDLAVTDSAAYAHLRQATLPPTSYAPYRAGSRAVEVMLSISGFAFFIWPVWALLGAAVVRPVLYSAGILALISALILHRQRKHAREYHDHFTPPLDGTTRPIPRTEWLGLAEKWQVEAHPAKLRAVIDVYNEYRARERSGRTVAPTFAGLLRILEEAHTSPRASHALLFAEQSAALPRHLWGAAATNAVTRFSNPAEVTYLFSAATYQAAYVRVLRDRLRWERVDLDRPLPRLSPPSPEISPEKPGWDVPVILLACASAFLFFTMALSSWFPGAIKWSAATTLLTILLVALFEIAKPTKYGPGRPRRLRRWLNPAAALFITLCAVGRLGQLGRGEVAPWLIVITMFAVGYPLYSPRAKVGGVRATLALILAAWTIADAWNATHD